MFFLYLSSPRSYESKVTFIPEPPKSTSLSGSLGGLASLAGQLGIAPLNMNAYSPDFFAELLRSREVLTATLAAKLPDPRSGTHEPRPLLELLDIKGRSPAERLDKAVRKLKGMSVIGVDKRTGIVSLNVRSKYPALSANVANLLVATVDSFNVQRRQSQSREQRLFTQRRLADAQRELRDAEDTLLQFLTANRAYQEAPLLRFEANRLERKVQLKQELYLSLSKSYEDARIAEVQDTPLLTVIDRAAAPTRPSSLGPKAGTVLGMFVGALIGVILAFIADYRASTRAPITAVQEVKHGPLRDERAQAKA
jgi:uncharacterized protein involved in exopolysaccharide biosynthesis